MSVAGVNSVTTRSVGQYCHQLSTLLIATAAAVCAEQKSALVNVCRIAIY